MFSSHLPSRVKKNKRSIYKSVESKESSWDDILFLAGILEVNSEGHYRPDKEAVEFSLWLWVIIYRIFRFY